MILPDVNLLIYAYCAGMPQHPSARVWWENLLSSGAGVALPWAVILGFIRISTNARAVQPPMSANDALLATRSWLGQPNVRIVEPGPRHLDVLGELLGAAGTAGALTTDAHLAALAIEHRCELHSNDADFARFPGLRWRNPLAG